MKKNLSKLHLIKEDLKDLKHLILYVSILIILVDMFLIKELYFLLIPITLLLMINIYLFNLTYVFVAKIGLGLLVSISFFSILGLYYPMEKIAVWAFVLLIISFAMVFREKLE